MKPLEEVQLNNFKAHKASLIAEINVESDNLSKTLEKKKGADENLTEILTKIAAASKEHEAILASSATVKGDADRKLKEAVIAQDELLRERAAFDEHKQKELAKIEEARAAAGRDIEGAHEILSDIMRVTPEKQAKLDELVKALESGNLVFETLQKEHNEFRISSAEERQAEEAHLAQVRRDRISEEKKLADTKAQVEDEIKKIGEPMKALSGDYARVARMSRDVDVYAARCKKRYEELYPGRPFKI